MKMRNRNHTIPSFGAAATSVLLGVALVYQASAAPNKAADLVIKNATIHTMDEAAGVVEQIGNNTEVINAEGHLMLPGFNETHLHLLVCGTWRVE